ncbi:MAG: cyclic nucleotide-binding domain-containing protein [Gammaproteobacteria bacterium]
MEGPTFQYFAWACSLGALSAASLPLGSWIGLRFRFGPGQLSVLAAFGAGALLAALSVELIAPTTLELVGEGSRAHAQPPFFAMIVGCVIGGLVYVALDYAVNQQGGFLRKTSTVLRYYRKLNRREQEEVLEKIASNPLLRTFPSEHVETLMSVLEPVAFRDGDTIVEENEPADAAFVILDGRIDATRAGERVAEIGPDEIIVPLMPMIMNTPIVATGIAQGDVNCLRISRRGFDQLRSLSPEFDRGCRQIAAERLEGIRDVLTVESSKAFDWLDEAKDSLIADTEIPEPPVLRRIKNEHHGAPLAVWLGILLDGIPESLVIGAGMLGILTAKLAATGSVSFIDVIPFTLVAGLFLSNFPEALSSSANMLSQGWNKNRIFLMWLSLMLITAAGAGIGYLLAGVLDPTWLVFFEGLAAGAMLTMIAAAMIPEAVLMGSGNIVGLSTLSGFLGAILFKLLE